MSSWWPRWRRTGWSAVGRRYGVSDNAVRKWVRGYERERAASSWSEKSFVGKGRLLASRP